MGVELYGKTLGIIGLGRIGTEVARRALNFKMKIITYDPFLIPERAKALGIESVNLDALFKKSDLINWVETIGVGTFWVFFIGWW